VLGTEDFLGLVRARGRENFLLIQEAPYLDPDG
jgi:hypothetical protein